MPWVLHRRLVTCQDDLLTRLVKVVEYVERRYPASLFLAGKLMNVINDQHVNHLVEVEKIILVIVPD
ncbi:MAG: hypothetical protein U5L72_19750 [Bacteroidales bacterium]|nr:hypothetical protein [Bacteroidales bacterium]